MDKEDIKNLFGESWNRQKKFWIPIWVGCFIGGFVIGRIISMMIF